MKASIPLPASYLQYIYTAWHASWATAKRKFIVQHRAYPWNFFLVRFFSIAYGLGVGFLLYRYLFHAQLAPSFTRYAQTADYMAYLILGSMVFLFLYGTLLHISRALITELREGTISVLCLAPSSLFSYLAGSMVQQTLVSLVEILVLLLLALLFQFHLHHVDLLATLVAWTVSLPGYFGMAMMLGAFMLRTRDTYILQNTVMLALEALCGFFFPVAYLPGPLQVIADALPVTWSLAALRGTMMGEQSLAQVTPQLLVALTLGIVYMLIGLFLSRWALRSATEGSL